MREFMSSLSSLFARQGDFFPNADMDTAMGGGMLAVSKSAIEKWMNVARFLYVDTPICGLARPTKAK
jgi:hypothetical protein